MSDSQSPSEGGPERRRHRRQSVHWSGVLELSQDAQDCLVLDISQGGACVQSSAPLPEATAVRLKLDQGDSFDGDIVWQHGSYMGLRFSEIAARPPG